MQTTLYVIYSRKLDKFYYDGNDEHDWNDLHQANFGNMEETQETLDLLACRGWDKYWDCVILPVATSLELPTG